MKKIFFLILFFLIPIQVFAYTSLSGIEGVTVPGASEGVVGGGDLGLLVSKIFYFGIVLVVVLAIFGIIRGGFQYMVSADSEANKTAGRNKIWAAIGGLLLAIGSILILQTINTKITDIDLTLEEKVVLVDKDSLEWGLLQVLVAISENATGVSQGIVDVLRQGAAAATSKEAANLIWDGLYSQNPAMTEIDADINYLKDAYASGERKRDGTLNITNYWDGDTGTNQWRGNSDNLLRPGSLALSPDLISTLGNPRVGSAIFINTSDGKQRFLGWYEDTTDDKYVNTVDVFDYRRRFGSVLANVPAGSYTLSVGTARDQIVNKPND
jgi:hypothetical protein